MWYFSQLAGLAKNLVAKLLDVLIASILYKFRKYSLPLIEERPENKDLSQGMFFPEGHAVSLFIVCGVFFYHWDVRT